MPAGGMILLFGGAPVLVYAEHPLPLGYVDLAWNTWTASPQGTYAPAGLLGHRV